MVTEPASDTAMELPSWSPGFLIPACSRPADMGRIITLAGLCVPAATSALQGNFLSALGLFSPHYSQEEGSTEILIPL